MKSIFFLALAVLFLNVSAFSNEEILLTIGDKEITSQEFERIYKKNSQLDILGKPKTVDEYLDLFINYKIKVVEAESKGLDTIASFKKEYNGYVNQLAEPYLLDQSVDSAVVLETYNRLLSDIRTSHILIKVKKSAPPRDTLAAYEKLLRIRERLIAGEDFEKVAKATSDDFSAKENGGDIGYGTAFSTVYPYENMMYKTEVGEISPIFRTKFGYHILKVTDKRPSRGQVKGAHIMITVPRATATDKLWSSAKETIDSIYNQLQAGKDFAELAKKYSTDTRSAEKGGEMDWIDNGMPLPGPFKHALYSLSENGQYSEPFRTSYGYHIVKLLGKRPFKSFEEMEESLRKDVAKDPKRANKGKIALINQLKKDYNLTINEKDLGVFVSKVGDRIMKRKWVKPSKDSVQYNETIFTFADQSISGDQFATWLEKNQKKMQKIKHVGLFVQNALDFYVADRLLAYEKKQLPEKSLEYKDLITEYHDGMLLFEISNSEVWKKANTDTTGLQAFHTQNKENYMWGERLKVRLYYCKDENVKSTVSKLRQKAVKKGLDSDFIIKKANAKASDNVKTEEKLYARGDNEIIDALAWEKGEFKEFGKTVFVEVLEVKTPEPKQLSECRGLVVADYQKELEATWIAELKKKYTVNINQEALQKLKN